MRKNDQRYQHHYGYTWIHAQSYINGSAKGNLHLGDVYYEKYKYRWQKGNTLSVIQNNSIRALQPDF